MGEYVQQTLEEMTNEVQQLEHAGLFDHSEVKKIVSRRKLFEYKLRRRVKDKQDYLMYVKYETKLLELIWLRRKTKGYNDKKVEIEGAILQRINKLFRLACRNWPQASELWESRIHFVKKVEKNRTQVSSLYTRALQVITNVPSLWLSAAKFELEVISSVESARHILLKGISFNKNSAVLWHELFRLELLYVHQIKRRNVLKKEGLLKKVSLPRYAHNDSVSKEVLQGKVAQTVFKHAMIENPGSVNLAAGFIHIVKLFKWATDLETEMFDFMFESFPEQPQLYELKCTRLIQAFEAKAPGCGTLPTLQKQCDVLLKQMMAVERSEQTWDVFLNINYRLLQLSPCPTTTQKFLLLLAFVERFGSLSEFWMILWVKIYQYYADGDLTLELFSKGVQLFPQSEDLWCNYLLYLADKKGCEAARNLFINTRKVRKDTLRVWEVVLSLSANAYTDIHSAALYEIGVGECEESLAAILKEKYLDWMYLLRDINKTRALYKRLRRTVGLREQFFKQYIDIENSQCEVDSEKIRAAHIHLTQEFGTKSVDVWLDAMAWEQAQGDLSRVSVLFSQAKKSLPDNLIGEFLRQSTTNSGTN